MGVGAPKPQVRGVSGAGNGMGAWEGGARPLLHSGTVQIQEQGFSTVIPWERGRCLPRESSHSASYHGSQVTATVGREAWKPEAMLMETMGQNQLKNGTAFALSPGLEFQTHLTLGVTVTQPLENHV